MKSPNVPHDGFSEGFTVGYQLIRGVHVGVPGAPGGPGAHGVTSRFLLGVKASIKGRKDLLERSVEASIDLLLNLDEGLPPALVDADRLEVAVIRNP